MEYALHVQGPILDRTISLTRYEWGIQHKATNEESGALCLPKKIVTMDTFALTCIKTSMTSHAVSFIPSLLT